MSGRKLTNYAYLLLLLALVVVQPSRRESDNAPARDAGPESEKPPAAEPLDRETYLGHRQSLFDGAGEAQQNLDKALLALSAGAFGLSIAFVSQVEPAGAVILMYRAWIAFGLSILCELASFVTAKWAHQKDVVILDEDYERLANSERRSRWNVATTALNTLAGLGFVSGAVCFTLFVARNVT
jgi:hypothetical protein